MWQTAFIQPAIAQATIPQVWADLGCGTGKFSHALSNLLPEGSHIHCMDAAPQSIGIGDQSVTLDFIQADFTQYPFEPGHYDGLLMANALHYVPDPAPLLERLKAALRPTGLVILVEYDTTNSNPWVPYPIPFPTLQQLSKEAGFKACTKIAERPSIYGPQQIYACTLRP